MSIFSWNQSPTNQTQPKWLKIESFTAETPVTDKVNRICNNLIFSAGIIGAYTLATGGSGLVAYASYAAMTLTARKIIATIFGFIAYPAALTSFPTLKLDPAIAQEQMQTLLKNGYIVKRLPLYKSGTCYQAYLIAHKSTIDNKKWSVHAAGNMMVVENFLTTIATNNFAKKCNTLLINGPSVNTSGGWPTRYQMGGGFEAGIQYLEKVVEATHIVMHGYSLGAGMMGEAILNHDFYDGLHNKNIRYLSISDRTFSRLSDIAESIAGRIAYPLLGLVDAQLDGIKAAKKLSHLDIRQIIIQHKSNEDKGFDGVIPDNVGLASVLKKAHVLKNKLLIEDSEITHEWLPNHINQQLDDEVKNFLTP